MTKKDLASQISEARQTIRSDSYSMSIGEVVNLYTNGEIVIRPEFQRLFRWSTAQKSRLIESILLGIPLPTIFVMQREDGVWEVIDGLQRLSTILEFMGELRRVDGGGVLPPKRLKATEYLPSLEGVSYLEDKEGPSLDESQRIAIRRAKLSVTILLPESDDKAKGELFDRLNAGGSIATPQEIRMAQFVMRDPSFARWLTGLKELQNFKATVPLSERLVNEGYDVELICRFMVLSTTTDFSDLDNIDDFLSARSYALLEDVHFDRDEAGKLYDRSLGVLAKALGEDAFRRYDGTRFKGAFSVSAYEVCVCGIAKNIDLWEERMGSSAGQEDLKAKVSGIWSEVPFTSRSGSGKSSKDRIPYTIPWARSYFAS